MKKTITFLSLLLALITGANAQYYYISHLNAGTNPGGLNTDIEQPSATGWTAIQTTSATPAWSSVATIPFSFTFNGNPYTSLMVSTSGVLTFTTSAVSVPASTSATLPSATIPDNSVCVWGLAGLGTNDKIWTKTFGTAPNRQFWIQFNSYSCIGSTGWTYWGIALEETTNKIFVVDQRSYLAPLALTIGIQIDASTAISIPGSPALGSNATTTADDTPIDNSYYEFVPGVQPANEAELTSVFSAAYVSTPGNVNVTGVISNYGSAPITSITIKYNANGNVATDLKTGINITSGANYSFTHSTPFSVPAAGTYPVQVWVELAGDLNQTNDTLNSIVNGIPFVPVKAVVFEEATGTWCGWCPRGAVFMDSMANAHPNETVLIAVHNQDPMVVTAYDAGIGGLIAGYPSACLNRNIVIDPSDMFTEFANHINDFGYADLTVSANYDAVTHIAKADVSAHFATDLSGDYRFAVVYTEDDLSGTTASWDQHNYYSFATNNIPLQGAGHDWQNETDPVLAADMEYDHVARTILGGFTGQAGSLPATISSGSTQTYSFNYTVPATYNISKMHVYCLLIDATQNKILNGKGGNIVLGINEIKSSNFSLTMYPNPTSESTNLNFNIKSQASISIDIIDVLGNIVQSSNSVLPAGKQIVSLDLSTLNAGVYSVRILSNGESVTTRLVVRH